MTDRRYHEATIITRNHEGAEHRLDIEVQTQSHEVDAAASEIAEAYAKEHGKETVTYVDASR